MLYVTFCYAPDASMLRMQAAQIHRLDPTAVIYAVNDPAAPITGAVEGVRFYEPAEQWPRGGNLNGLPAIFGQLQTYAALMRKHVADYIVKIDADVWPQCLEEYTATEPVDGMPVPDYLAPERWQSFQPTGCIYRLSRWAVQALLQLFNARARAGLWLPHNKYPEDRTIFAMVQQLRLPHALIPYASGHCVGFTEDVRKGHGPVPTSVLAAHIVHCGEPYPDGARCTRQHATLRMYLLDPYRLP